MTVGSCASRLARVYEVHAVNNAVHLDLAELAFPDLEISDGRLLGENVSVENRCVLVTRDPSGELLGRPMEQISSSEDKLCFDPSAGGVRSRENRLVAGGLNDTVAEATRFGMVNTFFHLTCAASYFNELLRELGAPRLPAVHAVVSAHSGSRLPGYGHIDGDFRQDGLLPLPFQGGHYRLSQLTSGVPEPLEVRPTGEIHLGPGRHRQPFAGQASYLRNAAHNPATIYHEYGHHLCRHTADFRLNAERVPGRQRNGKTGPEEGVCDYFTASLLGTGRPYGWYRSARGARRDPDVDRDADVDREEDDAHSSGARWASVFWRARRALLQCGLIESPREYDRAITAALLSVGRVSQRRDGRRRVRAAERSAPETMATAYLEELRLHLGVRAAGVASRLVASGLSLDDARWSEDRAAC